jgi:hypothetical protein
MPKNAKKTKTEDIPLAERLQNIMDRNPRLFHALATDNKEKLKDKSD